MNILNQYVIALTFTSISIFILGFLVLLKGRWRQKLYSTFAFYCFATAFWSFCHSRLIISTDPVKAMMWARIAHIGVAFIPMFFMHFIFAFLGIKKKKWILQLTYIIGITFLFFDFFSRLFVADAIPKVSFKYFVEPGPLYPSFLLFWLSSVVFGLCHLYLAYQKSIGARRNQLKYLFFGTLFGYLGGAPNFLQIYNIEIFPLNPFSTYGVPIYVLAATYAIIKYRLLDINLALTRAGIFAIVYTLVLGIPFWLGYTTKNWFPATSLAIFLATLGPFIYTRLRREAEERILKEEHHAHHLLMQASSGMTQERNLRKLLDLIVHFVPKVMKLKNASIYLLNKEATHFGLEAIRYKDNPQAVTSIDANDPLIEYIKTKRAPLVYEEMKSYPTDKNTSLPEILSQMKNLSASVILPCFIEETLLGFLILDDKKSGRMFTPEDLNVLTTLTNQAALAIENAQFYERDRENQALLYQSATLADMGVMADSMGHQIKNHIQKMMSEAGGHAGILEELLKGDLDKEQAIALLKRIVGALYNIERQGEAGGKLIESISKFSRLPKADFREITLREILDTANSILMFKVKFDEIDYNVTFPDNLPTLYAHPILSEAFVNLINNAYDAIKEKEAEFVKTGDSVAFKGRISVTAMQKNNSLEIKVSDNGLGIKKENLAHLFLPFYTTKATSAKGTGLGLFVIKKIVLDHKGAISIDSEYMQGTTFTITIPIRQER